MLHHITKLIRSNVHTLPQTKSPAASTYRGAYTCWNICVYYVSAHHGIMFIFCLGIPLPARVFKPECHCCLLLVCFLNSAISMFISPLAANKKPRCCAGLLCYSKFLVLLFYSMVCPANGIVLYWTKASFCCDMYVAHLHTVYNFVFVAKIEFFLLYQQVFLQLF